MNRITFLVRYRWLLAAIALSVLCDAAAWAHTPPVPLETTRQVGATAIVYKGPQVDVALSYRYAKANPTGTWLMLDAAMTSAVPIEIARGAISVRTPDGTVVPLATQPEFGKAYASLAGSIERANVAREPLGYLVPHRARRMELFSEPGRRVVFDSVWLDQWATAYGRLYFELPGGVRQGAYALLISLPQSTVRIPFTI